MNAIMVDVGRMNALCNAIEYALYIRSNSVSYGHHINKYDAIDAFDALSVRTQQCTVVRLINEQTVSKVIEYSLCSQSTSH